MKGVFFMEKSFKHNVTLHKDGTYSMGISINYGYMTPDELIALANIAKKYNVTTCMATTAKKISFMDVKEDDVNKIWDEIDETFGERLSYPHGKIVVCPGLEYCKFAIAGRDNKKIAKMVEEISLKHNAGKIKVGVTSCPLGCAMPRIKDLGIFGTPYGWSVVIGGNAGGHTTIAQPVADKLSDEELYQLLDKIYQYFEDNRTGKERTVSTIKRLGFEHFNAQVLGK